MNADPAEIGKFDAIAHRFWDPAGEFRPLHLINPVRTAYVAERCQIKGARILDVGCGGGLLCEALQELGAQPPGCTRPNAASPSTTVRSRSTPWRSPSRRRSMSSPAWRWSSTCLTRAV